ncbi:MAG: tetratricopeptide repeat protein, partial [Candidatus Omnitrophica bacterium]|nr:tetratricopeptide repeat protein [Candidatus Omnitrophota bacterium]
MKLRPLSLSSIQRHAFVFLLICVLGGIIYSNSFAVDYQWDDTEWIENNYEIRNIANLDLIWKQSELRFITHLTFALNYYFHGLRTFGYHLVNWIIHLGGSLLVYFLVLFLFKTPALRNVSYASHGVRTAFFGSLIFLTHPIQTQAVTYLVQRATSLATLLYLAVLILYLKARIERKKLYYGMAVLIAAPTVLTKPIVGTLPIALLLLEVFFMRSWPKKWYLFVLALSFFGLLGGILTALSPYRTSDMPFSAIFFREPGSPDRWEYFLTQLNVLRTYLRLLVLPVRQNLDYDYPISYTLLDWKTFLSFVLLLEIFLLGFLLYKKQRLISFGIFWFFLTLSLESSIFPLKDVIFEHRLYLPMVGFAIVLPRMVDAMVPSEKKAFMVLCVIVVVFSVMTYKRNSLWADGVALWQDTVQKSPHKARPYNHLGLSYLRLGKFDQAIACFQKSLEIDPNYHIALHNIGISYEMKGDKDQAIAYYEQTLDKPFTAADALKRLGNIYLEKEDYGRALEYSRRAVEMYRFFIEGYMNLALVYQRTRDFKQAIENYKTVLKLDPRHISAYNGLGYSFTELRMYDQALFYYQKVLSLGGWSPQTLSNLAFVYNQIGYYDLAVYYAERAKEIDPNNAEIYNNLGVAQAQTGKYLSAVESFKKALDLNPKYVEACNNLGAAYGSQGDTENETKYYKKALEINPQYSEAYYNLGYSYEERGKIKDAVGCYRKVLELSPLHSSARSRLSGLEKKKEG